MGVSAPEGELGGGPVRRAVVMGLLAAVTLGGGAGAMLAGGVGSSAAASPGVALAGVCPGAKPAGDVIRCTKLYGGAQPLRLPGDPADGARYGAFRRADPSHLVTRTGLLRVGPGISAAVSQAPMSGGSVPEYARTVYLATVSDGTVTALEPAVTITESAILRHVFGGKALEGRIGAAARRKGTYTTGRMLPIRVQLAASTSTGVLAGRIVNATRAVRAAGGRCLAPLTARGARDPLSGHTFTPRIGLQRRPSMHAPFNDELIARWNASVSDMGEAFYPSVATLLGKDPLGRVWKARIHGVPNLGPALDLHVVTGGGGRCR